MKIFKRVLSFALVLVLTLSLMPAGAMAAGANNRVKTFLKMAAGAEITNEDIEGMTMEQLVFLGVYLSNFYQPFGTEFGGANDEIAENCKSDMVKALQTKLAFSDEMANALVEYVLQMTRSSIQYLKVYSKGEDGYIDMSDLIYANYYNFLRLMVGNSSSLVEGYKNSEDGMHYVFGSDWVRDQDCFDTLVKLFEKETGLSYSTNPLYYFPDSPGNISAHDNCPSEDWSWYRTVDWASRRSPYSTDGAGNPLDWSESYILSSRRSVNYVTNATNPESVVDDSLSKDYELIVRTLYLYIAKGYSFKIHHPYIKDATEDYQRDFSKVINSPGITINYYARDTYAESGRTLQFYWSTTDLSSSVTVGASMGDVRLDQYGTTFRKVASTGITVDPDNWKECYKLAKILSGEPTYYYLGYEKNGEVKIVYDCATTSALSLGTNYTASQQQFMKCLETVDLSKGYGSNMLDFNMADSAEDSEWDANALKALCEKLTDFDSLSANKELALKATMWGQQMAIDCFGNIISMGANHQYIVVPACMNPFSWQAVDQRGIDIGNPGSFMNIINAKNLIQVDKGAIKSTTSSGTFSEYSHFGSMTSFDSSTSKHMTAVLNNYAKTSSGYNGIGTILTSGSLKVNNEIPARIIRGQGNYIVQDNSWWPWGGEDIAKTSIENIVKVYSELRPKDKTAIGSDSVEDMWGFWSDEYIPLITNVSNIATDSRGGWLGNNSSVNLLDGYVFIDNLGVYKNPDGSDHEFSAFNVEHYLDPSTGEPAGKIAGGVKAESDFGSHATMLISGKLNSLDEASEQALSSIYISYVYAYFYTNENKADTIGKIGYRYAKEVFPDAPTSSVYIDMSSITAELELDAIRDWTYYLLHPTKGFEYVRILLTNKLNHLLLGWHNDMVGTNGVGVTTGTTKYRSNVGYVTMPDLSEIGWTDKLIAFYQDCLPFLILVVMLFMLCAFITGSLSLQRSIFACVLFSLFLMLPTTLINGVVQQSNTISQRIYGEKFTYWAMVQQESYATQIDEAANADGGSGTSSYENYLRTLYGLNQQVYSNQGGESVLLKWQAPKKMASLVLTEADAQSLKGLDSVGSSMLYGMLGKSYGGQSYVDDEDSLYMYRSYIDISNFSRYIYAGIATGKVSATTDAMSVKSTLYGSFDSSLAFSMDTLASDYANYRTQGYTNWGRLENENMPNYDYLLVPLSSQIVADAVRQSSGLENFQTTSDGIAINQDVFNFGLPMFTSGVDFNAVNFAATGGIQPGTTRYSNLENYLMTYSANENAYVGLAAYSLYSENPFYYFSWKLYHDGLGYNSSLSDRNGYKNLLLGKRDGGYFYKNEGNGGLKDFMDMKSLFTYIIPYMKECNDLVRRWDDMYGIFVYEGVPTEEGHLQDVSSDSELLAKYWHNLNVSRLYCLYCPWVDIMYDCSYAQPVSISVMGKQVVIEDPLNPASYPNDRPMIFSEAEMKDYGLSTSDLTPAERLILKCNEDYQERMYELLNYYNFSDITLNTAAAMQCAFSFNTIFSETGIMSENHNIYPQSYDLANFSYDAFLRFILSESTGESMLSYSKTYSSSAGETSGDFYERVVNNSSTTTVIVMLILDILSVYVLPAFKMFFLVAIFVSSILIVFVSICKIEGNAKFIKKASSGFVLPLLQFFAVTVVFSWVISLFMGKGNNSVTQTDELSISMGDPVIALLAMIAIDLVALVLYWKIVNKLLKDIRFNSKMAFNFAGGVVTAVGASAVGAVTSAVTGVSNHARGMVDNAVDSSRHRRTRNLIKNLGEENAQQGTGRSSSRAERRGSKDVSGSQENSNRGSDSRRRTAKKYKSTGENSVEKRKKLNNTAKAGASKTKKSGGKRHVRLKR